MTCTKINRLQKVMKAKWNPKKQDYVSGGTIKWQKNVSTQWSEFKQTEFPNPNPNL